MNYMDAEELAMNVLGLSDEQADGADFDDLMYDKFEISMEQFHKVAEALSAFTVPMQAGISGKMFCGFVKDGYFITKDEVPSNVELSGPTAALSPEGPAQTQGSASD